MAPRDLVDRIYEAAFVPDLWPSVLEGLSALSDSASGAVLVFAGRQPPRWRATEIVQESLHEFCTTDAWQRSERAPYFIKRLPAGFECDIDYLTPEQLERDSVNSNLRALGLGWQLGTMVPMPSGEKVAFTFERRLGDGRHEPAAIAALDGLRPHLARAGLLAARLGLERARTAVAKLDAIGLPAAVLTASGRVLAVNGLVETLASVLLPTANGGLAIADLAANVLFRAAITASRDLNKALVRSIPVPADEDREAVILHLLPLRGAAHDIFSGAAVLLIATPLSMAAMVPDIVLLHGLFDLSPAEARLATGLASGRTLKEAAAEQGIRVSTARAYMNAIFHKTGTRQQSQLVALLKSTQPMPQREGMPKLSGSSDARSPPCRNVRASSGPKPCSKM